jgi:hypothetical protein
MNMTKTMTMTMISDHEHDHDHDHDHDQWPWTWPDDSHGYSRSFKVIRRRPKSSLCPDTRLADCTSITDLAIWRARFALRLGVHKAQAQLTSEFKNDCSCSQFRAVLYRNLLNLKVVTSPPKTHGTDHDSDSIFSSELWIQNRLKCPNGHHHSHRHDHGYGILFSTAQEVSITSFRGSILNWKVWQRLSDWIAGQRLMMKYINLKTWMDIYASNLHPSMHPSIHPYIHTYQNIDHSYMHAYIHICIQTDHKCMHAYIHTYMHACIHTYTVAHGHGHKLFISTTYYKEKWTHIHTCIHPHIHTYRL